jgi:hypothetical protein
MPSELFKQASKGDETALIEMIWIIEHNLLLPEDINLDIS